MKKYAILTVLFVLVFSMFSISCGSSTESSYSKAFNGNVDYVTNFETDVTGKIVYYFSEIDIKARDTKENESQIKDKLYELDGYVTKNEHLYKGERTHYALLYMHVPTENIFAMIAYLEDSFSVTSSEITSQDITEKLFKGKANYASKIETLERYEKMLESDSLTNQERLTIINYVDSIKSSIAEAEAELNLKYKNYEYSTILLEIGEKETLGDKILTSLLVCIPFALLFGFILLVNYIDYKRYGGKRGKGFFSKLSDRRHQEKQQDSQVAESFNEEKDK